MIPRDYSTAAQFIGIFANLSSEQMYQLSQPGACEVLRAIWHCAPGVPCETNVMIVDPEVDGYDTSLDDRQDSYITMIQKMLNAIVRFADSLPPQEATGIRLRLGSLRIA